jgi:hypothetical protein
MRGRVMALLGLAALGLQLACADSTPTDNRPGASQLVFSRNPTAATVGTPIAPAIQVTARDDQGDVETNFAGAVTVAIATNPGNASLSGTLTVGAVAGVATFSNLEINRGEDGYTLTATSGTLTAATSAAFDVSEVVTLYALPGLTCLNLETGASRSCNLPPDLPIMNNEDMYLFCCAQEWPVVVHNRLPGEAQIAHLRGRRYERVHLADTAGAGFTTSLLSEPFDTTRTVLILTGDGNVFKLGNPVRYGLPLIDSTIFHTARLN